LTLFPCAARIWLYQKPVDMRRSFDGLAAIAQNVLSLPTASGDWFVFVNRRRTQMKILYFDSGGYCIWAKRLERGRFQPLAHHSDRLQLDSAQLQCLISGLDWQEARKSKRFSPPQAVGMVNSTA
jgi:transposase